MHTPHRSLPHLGRTWLPIVLVSFCSGLAGAWVFTLRQPVPQPVATPVSPSPTSYAARYTEASPTATPFDPSVFAQAAKTGTESVVFIRTETQVSQRRDDYWSYFDFFGYRRGPISSAGSGVVLSADGYIVTNNHVIDGADKIEVSLPNKHTYPAKVVGTDPSTDLALLKVEAERLVAIKVGNSDPVAIGDWVLAVGNPFNLNYTVTAGIVSAKGRNINIVNDQFPIESFIQTDAAINPGNSGGALISLSGELIGINTAIASRTGSYAGYGFAIPSNIVYKVYEDLRKHGRVQKAYIGAEVVDLDTELGKSVGTDDLRGVLVETVFDGGAADKAGLKTNDIIVAMGDRLVDSKAAFLERLSLYRPGDRVRLEVRRGKTVVDLTATLQNEEGGLETSVSRTVRSEVLGADFTPLSKVEQQRLGVKGGFRMTNLKPGRMAQMGLPEGTVILAINGYVPETTEELIKLISQAKGRLAFDLVGRNGRISRYEFLSY